ncbi:uncharacterized protein [Ptychodera flava]|uniref:uncharacterized protein n=1 Tax=Ptychodera flava TaxID=63121 RepID=UPI003969DA76
MESKRAPTWLCLMLCLLVVNVGVDSKPLKQSDGDSHDLDIKESHRHRWDGWTEHVLKLHFKYMALLDLIKENMQKCTNYPNEMQCRPGRTKYLPNLADEDSGVLSFDLKEDVSGNYILQSAELYLHIVTSLPLSTSPHLLIVSHDTEQILKLSSNSENRSESDLKIELDVTDEAMLFLEAGTATRFNFTVDVSGDVTAVLILKLERVLAERPLVFDLLWPSKNVSGKGYAEHHHHHGSPQRGLFPRLPANACAGNTK